MSRLPRPPRPALAASAVALALLAAGASAGAQPTNAPVRPLVTPTAGVPATAPVPPRPLTREDVDAGTVRVGPVRYDHALLAEVRRVFGGSMEAPPRTVTVSPFPDVTFTLVLRRSPSAAAASSDLTVLTGEVQGVREGTREAPASDVQGSYSMVLNGGALSVSIFSSFGNYHVRLGLDGQLEAFQEDPGAPPNCAPALADATATPTAAAAAATDAAAPAAGASEIVVLVLHDGGAVSAIGGDESALQAEVAKGIDVTNAAFRNSGIQLTARLAGGRAHPVPASFRASARYEDDLRALQANPEVAELRRRLGADVVTLARGRGDAWDAAGRPGGGAARSEQGFGVVYARKLAESLGLAHVLGHALGAAHDPSHVDQRGGAPFARGWHGGVGADARRSVHVGTIMSHAGLRIPYFSTPRVRYLGVPVGTAQQDNARAIETARSAVAALQP